MTTIRKWICERLCEPVVEVNIYTRQESTDRITSNEIVELFDKFDGDFVLNIDVRNLHITDRSFKLVDIEHLNGYLKTNLVSDRKYVKESHDCDDFSAILNGDVTRWDSDLAFGIIHGKPQFGIPHAFNVCIGIDKGIYFVEPQTDSIQRIKNEQVQEIQCDWDIWLVLI